jgi:Predicted pPIWI-associating nuclease
MSLGKDELTHKVRAHFEMDFQRRVFDAAVKSFDHEDNPLRLNNFATALRELGRIWLEQLAPKEKIRACDWFEQEPNLSEKDGVTRAQRAKYAVQEELHDDFVLEQLHINVDSTIKEYTSLIKELNAYTHITEKTFDIPDEDAELQAMRALETFDQLSELIKERHDNLRSRAADAAKDALAQELFGEVNDELDCLSTHSSVVDVHIEHLAIVSLTPDQIVYQGEGSVDVRLQYGSDSDAARDDGAVTHDNYPLDCQFEAVTSDPLAISIVPGTLKIDTFNFYDDGED